MGNFGIQFSDNFSRVRPEEEFQEEIDETSEGFFQKSLAYAGYYTMIFVTFCVCMPTKVAFAANSIEQFFI
jgi:hypothetical protein